MTILLTRRPILQCEKTVRNAPLIFRVFTADITMAFKPFKNDRRAIISRHIWLVRSIIGVLYHQMTKQNLFGSRRWRPRRLSKLLSLPTTVPFRTRFTRTLTTNWVWEVKCYIQTVLYVTIYSLIYLLIYFSIYGIFFSVRKKLSLPSFL